MSQESGPVVVGVGEILWDMLPAGRQLGGAPANFAYHARMLGAQGLAVSRVGDDVLGREILERVAAAGLDPAFVAVDPDHPTGTVDVALDGEGRPRFTIREQVAWDYLRFDEAAMDLAARADAVCYGTLGQRSPVSRASLRQFVEATRPECLRVLDVNLRQQYYDRDLVRDLLNLSHVLKLNDEELPVVRDLIDLLGTTEECLHQMLDEYKLQLIVLTRGAQGSVLWGPQGRSDHPGLQSRVVDTVGAGDAFTAAVTMGLLQGLDLETINAFANTLAAYVCSQSGAMPPIPPEICRPPV